MRKSFVIVCLLLLTVSALAASSTPTITKRYKQIPLAEVLKGLEKKTHYTIVYNPSEVDSQRLITASFKDARLTSVVKRVFGKNYDVKMKKKIITVSLKPDPVTTASQPAQVPSQSASGIVSSAPDTMPKIVAMVGEDTVYQTQKTQLVSRWDTTMTVLEKREKRPASVQPTPKYAHCSHHLIFGLGMGYGEVYQHGHVAAQGDVSYAFFWNDNWGVSVGLGVDYYHSLHAYDNISTVADYTDTDTEPEGEIRIHERNMKDHLRLLTLNIPLMLQMEYPLNSKRSTLNSKRSTLDAKLYASLGVRIGYPVLHQTALTGDVEKTGYYEKWDLVLHDMHEYTATSVDEKSTFSTKTITLAPQAEVGVAFPVREDLAVGVGVYANVNTLNKNDYLPWQVGAKVSVRWHQPVKTKPLPTVYEEYSVWDTVYTVREITDTVQVLHYDTVPAAQKIVEVMEKSIIWFDLNDIRPKLDPADMLDELASILVAHPEQQIEVNGHTCDLGRKSYNEKLSVQRAQAVADLLIEKGVRPEQLQVHGYANSKPYYSKSHDRVLDRRVEIIPVTAPVSK